MQYKTGYVAFIDILGFCNYIKEERNPSKINDLLLFGAKVQNLFRAEPELQVALFSDTLIFTSSSIKGLITMLVGLVSIFFLHIVKNHHLCFRGVVVYGEYFHQNNMVFGPAIIQAAELEKTVVSFSRIMMTPDIIKKIKEHNLSLSLIKDIDGQICYNPFIILTLDGLEKKDGTEYSKLTSNLQRLRDLIFSLIYKYKGTSYIVKYFSLVYYYNDAINRVIKDLAVLLCREETEEEIDQLKLLKIDWQESVKIA